MSLLGWTNDLPDNWEAKPLRTVARYVVSNVDKLTHEYEITVRLCNYTNVYHSEFITLALDFMRATASEAEIEKFGVRVDDVLITKDSESWDDIGIPALVRQSSDDLVCGYHLALVRPLPDKVTGAFVFRCLQGNLVRVQLELAANGVTRFGIPKSGIGSLRLPIPPLAQQRAIADYLDRETARLDALVAEKERVLALLGEKRQALITRTVTTGLNPDVPLRDSGVPWLGEIPAHWTVTRLKLVGCVQTGITLGKNFGTKPVNEYPYIRVANVQDGYLDLAEVKSISVPAEEAYLHHLRTGDVLMNEGGDADKLGRGAIWTGQISPCLHQNHVFAVRPRRVSADWLNSWILGNVAKAYLESRAKRSTNLASISAWNLNEMPLLKPPDQEQRDIVDHITRCTAKIDEVRNATKRTITLIKERRSALIAAAVTGQIDIRETS